MVFLNELNKTNWYRKGLSLSPWLLIPNLVQQKIFWSLILKIVPVLVILYQRMKAKNYIGWPFRLKPVHLDLLSNSFEKFGKFWKLPVRHFCAFSPPHPRRGLLLWLVYRGRNPWPAFASLNCVFSLVSAGWRALLSLSRHQAPWFTVTSSNVCWMNKWIQHQVLLRWSFCQCHWPEKDVNISVEFTKPLLNALLNPGTFRLEIEL